METESKLHHWSVVDLSISIMTHPKRRDAAEAIADRVRPHPVRLAIDPQPDGPPTALRSATVAFQQAREADSTHHLLLQDDIEVPEDFVEAARRSVELHPSSAVSLYVEWGSRTATLARMAALSGDHAVPVVNPYVPTSAVAIPHHHAIDFATFLECQARADEADDEALLRFVHSRAIETVVMVPNLVEHRSVPSIVGNDEHGLRRSVCLRHSPAFEYNDSILTPPRLIPHLAWTTGHAVIVDLANDVPANHVPTATALAQWGISERTVRTSLSEAVSAFDKGEHLAACMSGQHLQDLWVTAIAFGAILHEHRPEAMHKLDSRHEDPLVAHALGTFAPGVLRNFVDAATLWEWRSDIASFLAAGMEIGAAEGQPNMESLPAA
ncbi:hypothetical protein [Natronoglycomyces albus]|uniref:Glycosyltransferase n=1 Tax=Natronoglycomyces albus TaxID=2811108 RepID=A0A895XTV2_9ACTN|nr:hypothetical protein [Natronoglycomyces albus]QSB06729.1 hypothetical protein JQS30_07515 [Natronoglycomyces albus]